MWKVISVPKCVCSLNSFVTSNAQNIVHNSQTCIDTNCVQVITYAIYQKGILYLQI